MIVFVSMPRNSASSETEMRGFPCDLTASPNVASVNFGKLALVNMFNIETLYQTE